LFIALQQKTQFWLIRLPTAYWKYKFNFSQPDSIQLKFSKTPEVRLKSAQANLIEKSIVVDESLFSFC